MKYYRCLGLCGLYLVMLIAMEQSLGSRVAYLALCFSSLWFVISLVLLSRPPAIPEFVPDRLGSDEHTIERRELMPPVPWPERIQLSLTVACGSSLLIWLSLILLAK